MKLITKWRQLVYFGIANGARFWAVPSSSSYVSFILFYFIFFAWLAGNESCLPFLWQYYSIYSGLAECVWLFCVSFEKMHASKSQPQAAFKSAVLSLLIVKMSERISDRWFKFIFELTATERSTTSGTVVWCVLGASRAKSWPVSKWVSE